VILSDRSLSCMYPEARPGPASIDLHLGESIHALKPGVILDPERDQSDEWEPLTLCRGGSSDGRWRLSHLRPYLGVTQESLSIDLDHVGLLHGVSSIGRLFLLIHVTAGLVDPGWTRGRLTLELFPLGADILLRPGMRIGQVTLHQLTERCRTGYMGKYQSDQHPVASRMWKEARP
jgi:dCTP deaminase